MKAFSGHWKTFVLMFGVATLSMGNKGCKKPAEAELGRMLKLEVAVGPVTAQPITGPNGETIDFPRLTNSLFYQQVFNSPYYYISNPIPMPGVTASLNRSRAVIDSAATNDGKLKLKLSDSLSSDDVSNGESESQDVAPSAYDEKILRAFGFLKDQEARQQQPAPLTTASTARLAGEGKLRNQKFKIASGDGDVLDMPACLYNMPQTVFTGDMISFELVNASGIGIGWGNNGPLDPKKIGGNFQFSKAELEIDLRADDPLTGNLMAMGAGVATQKKFSVGLGLPLGIPLSLDFMKQDPIVKTIRQSFASALDKISKSFLVQFSPHRKWEEVWETRVIFEPSLANNDTHIAFRGGMRGGMQIGDTFTIKNLNYGWTEDPCTSELKYKIPTTPDPIAEATIIQVGDNVAVAKVEYLQDVAIRAGAQIRLKELFIPPPPPPTPTPAPAAPR